MPAALLASIARLREVLPQAHWSAEIQAAQAAYAAVPDERATLDLALLLALAPAPSGDPARARVLLESIAGTDTGGDFLWLLSALGAARAEAEDRAMRLSRSLDGARQRSAALQRRLEAITEIENQIIERDRRSRSVPEHEPADGPAGR